MLLQVLRFPPRPERLPGHSRMERTVTNPFTDRLKQTSRPDTHSHAPSPAEIQRWENDGGSIHPDKPARRTERHHRDEHAELAAA
jgi:hypothetical protein